MFVSFIILHYLTENDTVECIESILTNVDYDNYKIIVVDNGSYNQTGMNILNKYQTNEKVDVILSEKNIGFAKGNNLGFQRAKNSYNSDFIVVLNNDTFIDQKKFIDVIFEKFNKYKYGVMGPDIISTVDHLHQNPQPIRVKSTKDGLFQLTRHIALYFLNLIRLEDAVKKIINKRKDGYACQDKPRQDKDIVNAQLHGSCLIFSPKYIEKFDGFYEKTFMYFEEDILYYRCMSNNLKTLYSPDAQLYHKEDSATDEYLNNSVEKNRFIYKHSIKSIYLLLKMMK